MPYLMYKLYLTMYKLSFTIIDMRIARNNLSDEVYERLLDLIRNLTLEPGSRLDFNELEDRFGVSRAPIREAVQRLIGTGLITTTPHGGYHVVKLGPEDIRSIFEVRRTIEKEALERSIHKIPSDKLVKIRAVFEEELKDFNEMSPKNPSKKYKQADWDLHFELIVGYSGSIILKQLSSNIFDLVETSRSHIRTLSRNSFSHIRIIDAIMQLNLEMAILELDKHLEQAESRAVESSISKGLKLR